jgi:hypothetical protein
MLTRRSLLGARHAESNATLRYVETLATQLGAAPAVGDEVRAADGAVGRVSAVLRSDTAIPRFMVVATGRLHRRYPVISCGLITEISGGIVRVHGDRAGLRRLSEDLPIVV